MSEARMNARVRAFGLLAKHRKVELRDMLSLGYRHIGTTGGDHVIRDPEGRLFGVDLVARQVKLFVGYPPRVSKW